MRSSIFACLFICLAGPSLWAVEISEAQAEPVTQTAIPVEAAGDGQRLEGEAVVVTGTRTPRRLSDAPVRTELVRREQLAKTAARTLAEALDYSTGVRVENNCNNCNFQQLRLIGMEGPYSSVLLNGMQTQGSLARVYGIEQVPAALIEKVEIVKGGGSALYGPNAVAGVVNVLTKDPKRSSAELGHTWSTHGAGSGRSSYGIVHWAAAGSPWGLSLYGQGDFVPDFDHNGDGYSEVSTRDFNAAGARLVASPWAGAKLAADYGRSYENRRGGDNLTLPVVQANIAEAVQSIQQNASLSLRQEFGAASSVQAYFSQAEFARDSYYGAGMDPDAFGDAASYLRDTGAQVDLGTADRAHVLTLGAQYIHEDLRDRTLAYGRDFQALRSDAGFYAQHDWRPLESVELLYGARWDQDSWVKIGVTSPRATLMLKPAEGVTLRATGSMGFRSPLVFDEDNAVSASGGQVVVMNDDPGLVEERTHSYLAGAEYRHGPYMCEVNGFLNDVRNLFLSVDTDDPATLGVVEYTRVNFGDAKIWGGELNLGYAWGWNTWQLGYVEQRALRNDSDPTYGSNEYFRTPTRYGIFTWDLDSPWAQLFAAVRYTGPMAVPHAAGYIAADRLERSPDFWELDLSLSKAFDLSDWLGAGLTLTAGGKNVANAYQGDLDQGPNRDAAYVYGPRFPRSWFASAKLEF